MTTSITYIENFKNLQAFVLNAFKRENAHGNLYEHEYIVLEKNHFAKSIRFSISQNRTVSLNSHTDEKQFSRLKKILVVRYKPRFYTDVVC